MADSRQPAPPWNPTRLLEFVESYDTSMGTTKFKSDASLAFIKVMGNRHGPHGLASELVGSSLAKWFGLTVPDFTIFRLPADACFDLPRGNRAQPGPAFLSRHVPGHTWGGSAEELQELENPTDVTRLVVFDTWLRNCDRYPPDPAVRRPNYNNVYLADAVNPGSSRLIAIDHTHCFDCGRDLTVRLADIDKTRDERTYGLFPAFVSLLNRAELTWCKVMLESLTRETVVEILASVPREWEVSPDVSAAWCDQILQRADFICGKIEDGWPIPPMPINPKFAKHGTD